MRWGEGACGVREKRIHTGIWWRDVRGRYGRSWEDDIKMNPKEMEWQGVEWVTVSQDMDKRRAVVITVMNNRVTGNAGIY
jgi:hypothetical protein